MTTATTGETFKELNEGTPIEATVVLSPSERLAKAEAIVKNNIYWSMGVGAIPVPIIDLVGIAGFQIRMIKDLSHVYGVRFSEHTAKNIVSALIGSIGARVLTVAAVGSMIKTLPFVGAVVGGIVVMPVISGACTYAVGRVFVRHFESGGSLLNFDTEKAKSYFSNQFQAGKSYVSSNPAPAAPATPPNP